MVASWRVKWGFLGWRMAQIRRIITRMVKVKIRRPVQHRRIIIRRSLWSSAHFSSVIFQVVVAVANVVVEGGGEELMSIVGETGRRWFTFYIGLEWSRELLTP